MKDWRTPFAFGLVGFWIASYIASALMGNYVGVGLVTPVMVIAASFLLDGVKRNGRNS